MLSDLRRAKLTKMFRYLDGDHDGVLEPGDYQRMSSRLVGVLAAPPDSKEAAEIAASYDTEWRDLEAAAAQHADKKVSLDVWLGYRDAQLSGPDAFAVMIDPYVETVFNLLDSDGDGCVSSAEVSRYLGVYGMREVEKREILDKIDPQQRGSFTRQEIGELARQYYFSDDENAPGSWLLGRFYNEPGRDRRNKKDVADWLVAEISRLVGAPREDVDVEAPITNYLADSRDALTLAADLQDWLGVEMSADIVWDHPTISALSAHVEKEVFRA